MWKVWVTGAKSLVMVLPPYPLGTMSCSDWRVNKHRLLPKEAHVGPWVSHRVKGQRAEMGLVSRLSLLCDNRDEAVLNN